jgi:L-alanine-DL-glutamate epimerase-like enolase superfamily enzyme
MRGGWIESRDTPGLGVTVDEAAVKRNLFPRARFRLASTGKA